jgi:hypothetical protein
MNTAEKEAVIVIHHLGSEHKVPALERGCDGCAYQSQEVLSSAITPVYSNRELDHVEETYCLTAWCELFKVAIEGGPCKACREKRLSRAG